MVLLSNFRIFSHVLLKTLHTHTHTHTHTETKHGHFENELLITIVLAVRYKCVVKAVDCSRLATAVVYKVSMHVQQGNFYLRNTECLRPKLRSPANIVSEFGYPTHHKYRLPLVPVQR